MSISIALSAQDFFLGVTPITDRVLLLRWSEGSIIYAPEGEWFGFADQVSRNVIDTTLLKTTTSFSVTSSSDGNYTIPVNPESVGLKFKAREASYNGGTPILEHSVYLTLPEPLQPGNTYTINFDALNVALSSSEYTFDPMSQISETVHISQIGFVPSATYKVGYLYQWMGDGGPLDMDDFIDNDYHIIDELTNEIKYSGKIVLRKDIETDLPDATSADGPFYSGANVYECNFSDFTESGNYRLYVPKVGISYPFTIDEDAYRDAFITSARGLYHHRSGPAREEPYTSFPKGVDHMPGVDDFKVHYSEVRWIDKLGSPHQWFDQLVTNKTTTEMPEAWGGWFDAGDFDRQAIHMVVSQLMLFNYFMTPEKFIDGELNIPESGNGIPDIIDEAYWGIDLFKRCKGPTGGIIGGVEAEEHPPQVGSVLDGQRLDWFTFAEGPLSSFVYVQSIIQYAIALEIAGSPRSQELFIEASDAYQWALSNMINGDKFKLAEQWLGAAAWMYYYTGDSVYQGDFKHLYNSAVRSEENYYTGLAGFLFADYPNKDLELEEKVRSYVIEEANELTDAAEQRASRLGSLTIGNWTGVGRASTPYNHALHIAHKLTGESKYLDYSRTTADYFLGGNAINKVYVTGLGENPVKNLFNFDAFYDGIDEDIPGIIPYGFHTYGNWMFYEGYTVFDPIFNYENMYPHRTDWPSHEFWWENRYCIITNEYTMIQNQGPAVSSYAYLVDDQTTVDYESIDRFVLAAPYNGQLFLEGDDVPLSIVATIGSNSYSKVKIMLDGEEYATIDPEVDDVKLEDLVSGDYELAIIGLDDADNEINSTSDYPISFKMVEGFTPNITLLPESDIYTTNDIIEIYVEQISNEVDLENITLFIDGEEIDDFDLSLQKYDLDASTLGKGIFELQAVVTTNLPRAISTEKVSIEIKEAPVSVDEISEKLIFGANPAFNHITLFTDKTVDLFDLQGKLLMTISGKNQSFDISHLSSGIYLLREQGTLSNLSQKLIIK